MIHDILEIEKSKGGLRFWGIELNKRRGLGNVCG